MVAWPAGASRYYWGSNRSLEGKPAGTRPCKKARLWVATRRGIPIPKGQISTGRAERLDRGSSETSSSQPSRWWPVQPQPQCHCASLMRVDPHEGGITAGQAVVSYAHCLMVVESTPVCSKCPYRCEIMVVSACPINLATM